MSDITTTITLPSNGIIYDDPALSGNIKLSVLTTKDEIKIFGASVGEDTLGDIIKSHTEPSVNASILTSEDRAHILTQLRIITYGENYHTTYACPICDHVHEYEYNLGDVEVDVLPDDFTYPIEVKLPKSETVLGVKFLSSSDKAKIDKKVDTVRRKSKRSPREVELEELFLTRIVTINGESAKKSDKLELLNNMLAYDSAYLDYELNKIRYGSRPVIELECPNCGEVIEVPVVITEEFFRPRFDK